MTLFNKCINRSRKLRSRINHCNFWCLGPFIVLQTIVLILLYIFIGFGVDACTCFGGCCSVGDANVYIYVNGEIPRIGTDMSKIGSNNIQRTGGVSNFA